MSDKMHTGCTIATAELKNNYNICFHNGSKEVGVLDFNGSTMKFDGEAEESAKLFFDFIARRFSGRLELERKTATAQSEQRIKELKTRLSGKTCFVPPEIQAELDAAKAEIERKVELLNLEKKLTATLYETIEQIEQQRDKLLAEREALKAQEPVA